MLENLKVEILWQIKSHPFARDDFEYCIAYFKDLDGTLYKLTVSVGKNGVIHCL